MKNEYFVTHTTEELLKKVHELVEKKHWRVKAACKMHGCKEAEYFRFKAKLPAEVTPHTKNHVLHNDLRVVRQKH